MDVHALTGRVALDVLLQQASPELIAAWDGTSERVAYVVEEGPSAKVGFLDRHEAATMLDARADDERRFDIQICLRAHAATLREGAKREVQCVVLGWGGVALVEIEPDDLRPLSELAPRGVENLGALIDACANRVQAVELLARARQDLADDRLDELAEAQRTALEKWSDTDAIERAVVAAITASERHLATAAGQRARTILNALLQATRDRAYDDRVNSKGGLA